MSTIISASEQITVAPEGDPGPLFYPAGTWSKEGEYTRNKDLCPFVLYDTGKASTSFYYFLTKEGTYNYDEDKDVADFGNPSDSAKENGVWRQMTKMEYVFSKFLMADHALLAGAVAHDNKLFSQHGTINGKPAEKDEDYIKEGFLPNLSLDWKEGKLECNNVDIVGRITANNGTFRGEIYADGGTIGDFRIKNSRIESKTDTGFSLSTELIMYSNKNDHQTVFAGIGAGVIAPPNNFYCPMRVEISTVDHNVDKIYGNIGIHINVKGKSLDDRLTSYGNHALYIEEGYITGFRLRPRRINESMTLTNVDSWIFSVATSSIIITLPDSPKDGQIYFIRKANSGNITVKVNNRKHSILKGWNQTMTSFEISHGNLIILMWDEFNLIWTPNYCSHHS